MFRSIQSIVFTRKRVTFPSIVSCPGNNTKWYENSAAISDSTLSSLWKYLYKVTGEPRGKCASWCRRRKRTTEKSQLTLLGAAEKCEWINWRCSTLRTTRVEYFIDLRQPALRSSVYNNIAYSLCALDMIVKMTLSQQQQLFEPDKPTENTALTKCVTCCVVWTVCAF